MLSSALKHERAGDRVAAQVFDGLAEFLWAVRTSSCSALPNWLEFSYLFDNFLSLALRSRVQSVISEVDSTFCSSETSDDDLKAAFGIDCHCFYDRLDDCSSD